MKLRTPKGVASEDVQALWGKSYPNATFSDVFTALKTGVIDGQENPYAQIASAKFQEGTKISLDYWTRLHARLCALV